MAHSLDGTQQISTATYSSALVGQAGIDGPKLNPTTATGQRMDSWTEARLVLVAVPTDGLIPRLNHVGQMTKACTYRWLLLAVRLLEQHGPYNYMHAWSSMHWSESSSAGSRSSYMDRIIISKLLHLKFLQSGWCVVATPTLHQNLLGFLNLWAINVRVLIKC
jgi:hypothetical protein